MRKLHATTRQVLALFLMGMFSLALHATPVTLEQARQRAKTFITKRSQVGTNPTRPQTTSLNLNFAEPGGAYYVFDNKEGKGYVIVSGDDTSAPIIGYADNGEFDANTLPAPLREILDAFAARAHQQRVSSIRQSPLANKAEVKPLLGETSWGQDSPYNNMCPTYDGQPCATGCVATAMAQLMYFYQWPQGVAAMDAYTTYSLQINCDALPATTFDWQSMAPKYTRDQTDASAIAVAQLMRYCGQAMLMDYTPGGSGASTFVVTEMAKYFDYNPSAYVAERSAYTEAQWDALIYSELSAGHPVIYGGMSGNGAGHEFICDGYDGNGFFHINWGWDGLKNGYFLLSLLNEDNQYDTDGVPGWGGYGYAHIGLYPNKDHISSGEVPYISIDYLKADPSTYSRSGSSANFKDVKFQSMIYKYSNSSIPITYGLGLFKNGEMVKLLAEADDNPDYIFEWNPKVTFGKNLATGNYTVKIMYREREGSEWRPIPLTPPVYLDAKIEAKKLTLTPHDDSQCDFTLVSMEEDESFQQGYHLFKATITNNGEVGATHLNMYSGSELVRTTGVQIDPGATKTITMEVWLNTVGQQELTLCEGGNDNNYHPLWQETINVVAATGGLKTESWKPNYSNEALLEVKNLPVVMTAKVKNSAKKTYQHYVRTELYKQFSEDENDPEGWAAVRDDAQFITVKAGKTSTLTFNFGNKLEPGWYMTDLLGVDSNGRFTMIGRSKFKIADNNLLGDVDNNGLINISDVTAIISYILSNSPNPFNAKHADANGDGLINISDVTDIINIILNKSE